MILELGDGRELKLPDGMDEGDARLLGRFIKATEERATRAEEATDRQQNHAVTTRLIYWN